MNRPEGGREGGREEGREGGREGRERYERHFSLGPRKEKSTVRKAPTKSPEGGREGGKGEREGPK